MRSALVEESSKNLDIILARYFSEQVLSDDTATLIDSGIDSFELVNLRLEIEALQGPLADEKWSSVILVKDLNNLRGGKTNALQSLPNYDNSNSASTETSMNGSSRDFTIGMPQMALVPSKMMHVS